MTRFLRRALVVWFVAPNVFLGGTFCRAEESIQSQIDPLVQSYLESKIVMGMAIGVIQKDQSTVLGFGRLSEKDKSAPDGDTVYEIGSVSKVFTGTLLADAVVREKAQLDQLAGELLPEGVKMPTHETRAITLQDLATHVSGLPRLPDQFQPADWNNPYADFDAERLHAFLNRYQLPRAPGEKSEYSNLGMGLLGYLLSRQAGVTYEQLLRDRIAKPLKMRDTTITLSKQQKARLAPPYAGDNKPNHNWDLNTLAGAGGIRSTANDMLRFAQAQLHPPAGKLGEAIDLAWQVHQQPLAEGEFAMGLAWHVARDGSTRWHNGQTGGYHASIFVSRELDAAVVLLTNTATMEVDQLAQDIFKSLVGMKVEPRKFEKTLDVPAEVMQRYVGKYQLIPGVEFTVSVNDGKLMVGLTGQPTFQVFARSETEWFYKVVPATITFEKSEGDEKCPSLELFQNGVRQKATRME